MFVLEQTFVGVIVTNVLLSGSSSIWEYACDNSSLWYTEPFPNLVIRSSKVGIEGFVNSYLVITTNANLSIGLQDWNDGGSPV